MPYLASHKTLFIHIPKCAGTSIEKWLSNLGPLRFRDDPVEPSWTLLSDCSRGHIKTMHLSYLDHVALLDLDPDDTFSFAIIRNPFTKIFSHYLYMHERYDGPEGTVGKLEQYALAGTSASFGEFITRLTERKDLWARFGQLDYLLNKQGEVGVDILLRFENLKEEFALVKKAIFLKKPLACIINVSRFITPLPVKNALKSYDYRSFYSKETSAQVKEIFRTDFERLNYSTDVYA